MADNESQDIIVTADRSTSAEPAVRYQNIEDFRDNLEEAKRDVQADLARTQEAVSNGIHSRRGMGIDEIAERAEGFFARTSERIDKIDGVADGVLRVPGMEEAVQISDTFAEYVGQEARENFAAVLSDQADIDKNGRISRTETEILSAAASARNEPSAQNDSNLGQMASGNSLTNGTNINPFSGILAGFQPISGMSHDAGAPPHDAATSSPPAVQNDKAAAVQLEDVAPR